MHTESLPMHEFVDVVNGSFEIVGAVLCWKNFAALRRDKIVRGVDWRVTGFFTAWGFWNLIYYPVLGQVFSAVAGAVLALGNLAWVLLYLRYAARGKHHV